MSENQSFPASSDASEQSISSQAEHWETAPIPGTVNNLQGLAKLQGEGIAPEREGELLELIHDLNQCNDVLLSRVTQLETALETSQSSHRSAREASSRSSHSAQQQFESAQQQFKSAQQQVAKLVGELDNAEQALSRQILISENLQTEVDNQQERISQLERECTIVAQQHLEEVQARAKAEATSKDLRSRLQRQQRYTMQFKAALEKSLTVAAKSSGSTTIQPVAFKNSAAVAMPKAQRIMPWVSDNSSPFAGIDPHLESLIRGVGKSGTQTSESRAIPEEVTAAPEEVTAAIDSSAAALERDDSPDAKAKLWQDIERVMNHSEVEVDKTGEKKAVDVVASDADATASNQVDAETEQLKDDLDVPSNAPLPLQPQASTPQASTPQASTPQASTPQASTLEANRADDEMEKVELASADDSLAKDDLIHQIERSFAATSRQTPEAAVAFTEPSPWGAPLSEKQPDRKLEKIAADVEARQASSQKDSYLPVVDSQADSAVPPLVKPLRVSASKAAPTQKRSGSLSDIELPTFQNAKVASFRR